MTRYNPSPVLPAALLFFIIMQVHIFVCVWMGCMSCKDRKKKSIRVSDTSWDDYSTKGVPSLVHCNAKVASATQPRVYEIAD